MTTLTNFGLDDWDEPRKDSYLDEELVEGGLFPEDENSEIEEPGLEDEI